MSDPAPAAAVPRSAGLSFGGWFLGFFLVAVGWAILVPFNQYPDEQHHVYRAAALVRGDLTPHIGPYILGTGGILPVPQSLHAVFTPDACTGFATVSQCEATADPDTVIMVSAHARVNPLYYAVVGLPTLLWPDANGILAMRVLSGALAAALLAAAVTVVLSLPGRRVVLLAALFAGLTPLALNLTGSINPSTTELASAACFWAAVLALIHGRSSLSHRTLAILATVSGTVLVTSRFLGVFFAAVAVVVSLLTADRTTQLRFLRGHVRSVFLPVGIAGVFAVAWTVAFRADVVYMRPDAHPLAFGEVIRVSLGMTGVLLEQTVAWFGQLTVPPPPVTLIAWCAIVGLVVVIAMSHATRRSQLALAVGLVLVLVIPFGLTVIGFPRTNIAAYQGRYTLPLVVGIALLAVAGRRAEPAHPRRIVAAAWALLSLFAVGQAAAVIGAVRAFAPFTLQPIQASGLVVLTTGFVVLGVRIVTADRSRPALSDVD